MAYLTSCNLTFVERKCLLNVQTAIDGALWREWMYTESSLGGNIADDACVIDNVFPFFCVLHFYPSVPLVQPVAASQLARYFALCCITARRTCPVSRFPFANAFPREIPLLLLSMTCTRYGYSVEWHCLSANLSSIARNGICGKN